MTVNPIHLRKSSDRGHFDHGWLDTYHTFSFGDYHDSKHMGFRALRVINEDRVQPSQGFGTHSHRDMEIVTYVLEGALEHKDSLGNASVIRPGEVQRMTAGTGVTHSEYNASKKDSVHLLQLWILPEKKGLVPGYEQKSFDPAGRVNRLRLIVSPDGREGSVKAHQDVLIFEASLRDGGSAVYKLAAGRGAWIQVTEGTVSLDGVTLGQGDGAATTSSDKIKLTSSSSGSLLLFDLA